MTLLSNAVGAAANQSARNNAAGSMADLGKAPSRSTATEAAADMAGVATAALGSIAGTTLGNAAGHAVSNVMFQGIITAGPAPMRPLIAPIIAPAMQAAGAALGQAGGALGNAVGTGILPDLAEGITRNALNSL